MSYVKIFLLCASISSYLETVSLVSGILKFGLNIELIF